MSEIILKSTIDVELIQQCGNDAILAHAAWVSTRGIMADIRSGEVPNDPKKVEGVLRFLMEKRHGTPFEHGFLTVRVHAPIKVWRECHRHRVGWSYNEESGRYKQLDPVFWLPPLERKMIRPEGFKSSRPEFDFATDAEYAQVCNRLEAGYTMSYATYEQLLKMDVDRGLARDVLGVGIFSACWCSCNPRSLMHFLGLRTDKATAKRPSKPLWEIENAANQLEGIFAQHWPLTYKLWNDYGRMCP